MNKYFFFVSCIGSPIKMWILNELERTVIIQNSDECMIDSAEFSITVVVMQFVVSSYEIQLKW